MTATYDKLELHLAAVPLSRAHAQRIKRCGGTYSQCRGPYANKRFVVVPTTEPGLALIDELIRTYRNGTQTTVVARGGDERRPAWVNVQYVNPTLDEPPFNQFARKFIKTYVQATARGLIR